MLEKKYFIDNWPTALIKRDMNNTLRNFAVSLEEELKFASNARFGTEDWKEFNVLEPVKLTCCSRFKQDYAGTSYL
jgi:hypothetical protein